ncbi:Ger(x)C family spore germination protein [Brevibacillus dissolubilis]|uniref:Ger(x)C family spore germination protein n=1 Tax=Brevibacillus dissolubilis TaxID=1844116 RepID=UPI0011176039|nr:Ger(x)C family spore germination protein [Brevibacillus dissolubilis]
MIARIALVLVLLLLTGCGDQRILEELGFARSVAYDTIPDQESDGRIQISATIPKANQQEKIFFTTIARTSKEARIKFSKENNRRIVSGQMRSVLFGIDLAKKGLWDHIDTLIRDPQVSANVHVILVEGSGGDLLKKEYKPYPQVGEYIDELIKTEARATAIPDSRLYDFSRDYYDDGADPVAPILKSTGAKIKVVGIGLFRDDRYVTRIPTDQFMFIAFLRGDFRSGDITMRIPETKQHHENVMLSSMVNKRTIHVTRNHPVRDGHDIQVDIEMEISGSLLEYTGQLKLQRSSDQIKLETIMNKYIKQETERVLKSMQKHRVDSIGLGQYVRNKLSYEEWKNLDWNKAFADVRISVHPHIKIKDYGKLQE